MSTQTAAARTDLADSSEVGLQLGRQLREGLGGEAPDAVVLFASSRFDPGRLLAALSTACEPRLIVGASSAGEIVRGHHGEGTACALAIKSTELELTVGLGRAVARSRVQAARELVYSFRGLDDQSKKHRTALVLTDAAAGHAEDLVEQINIATSATYQFAGGQFAAGVLAPAVATARARTHVFCGLESYTDAVVALEVLSTKPVGIGVAHGWTPVGAGFRVTGSEGARLTSLDDKPAVEVFEAHARATGQTFDRAEPQAFFLRNVLGIETSAGHRLRVPLSVGDDGSITCMADVPSGATVHVMQTTTESSVAAALQATQAALKTLDGAAAEAALFLDCVTTRLRTGEAYGPELDALGQALGDAKLVGCNTHGELARAKPQFGGYHNGMSVVMLLPLGA